MGFHDIKRDAARIAHYARRRGMLSPRAIILLRLVPRGTSQPWWKPCLVVLYLGAVVLWGDLASVRQTLVGSSESWRWSDPSRAECEGHRSGGVDLTKRQRRLKLSIGHGRAGARRGGWRLVVETMFHENFLQAHQQACRQRLKRRNREDRRTTQRHAAQRASDTAGPPIRALDPRVAPAGSELWPLGSGLWARSCPGLRGSGGRWPPVQTIAEYPGRSAICAWSASAPRVPVPP